MTEITAAVPTSTELDQAFRVSKALAMSGMFKDARQAEQALAKVLLGRDLGLSPTMAMTSIHVVEGKPELSANLQAQLVKSYVGPEGERYDYSVREHTPDVCVIEFRRRERGGEWETLGTERFTIDDAKAAGLVRANSPWTKYPRNMLWARAISNGVNFHCPEVARGLRVYHEGEISGAQDAPQFVVGDDPITDHTVEDVVDAVELIDDEHAVEILKGVELLASAGVKVGTVLMAHGAAVDPGSIEATVRSLPAGEADAVFAWVSGKVEQVSVDDPGGQLDLDEARAEA